MTDKKSIAGRLRNLSLEMSELAADMGTFGSFAEWGEHALELAGAAVVAGHWADKIEADND
jgi:hypothetical protein